MQPFSSSALCLVLGLFGFASATATAYGSSTATGSPTVTLAPASTSTSAADPAWSEPATSTAVHASSSAPAPSSSASAEYGSTPAFVVYTDKATGETSFLPCPSSSVLSFLVISGPADQALAWQSLSDDQKAAIKNEYNAAGVSIIVSTFGATDAPTSGGADPVGTANWMAQWVLDNQLDGIDVDYEDLAAMNARDGSAEAWLVSFTETLRKKLPKGHYLLTHAPVAPWFSPVFNATGAYLAVDQKAGDLIDWGEGVYTTCDGLLHTAGGDWPGSALLEIAGAGVDLNKLLIGKYAAAGDGATGFMEPAALAECVAQAKEHGWNAGIMTWQYPTADSTWIKTARGTAFPL
ncbi:hypothetical protein BD413DRAFT_604850 [Trametes elegans]|nr:hypothetical protein BD413DRAFT_604850 [Trametes elegans]